MKKVKGFTVTEFLVSATVIIFMAGMLFPVLKATTERARRTIAINDLRTISAGWTVMPTFPSTSTSSPRFESSEWKALPPESREMKNWKSIYSTQALWQFYLDGKGYVTDGRVFVSPNKRVINNKTVPGFTSVDEEFRGKAPVFAKAVKELDPERAHDCEISYGLTYNIYGAIDEGKRIIIADMGRTDHSADTSIQPFKEQREIPSIDDFENGKFGFRNFDSVIIVLYNGGNAADVNTVAPEESSEDIGIYTVTKTGKDKARLKSTYIPSGSNGQTDCVIGCYHNNIGKQ